MWYKCYYFFKVCRKSGADHFDGLRKGGKHLVLPRLTLLYVVHVSVCESALSATEKERKVDYA